MTRTFETRHARREKVPLWIGLYGPSNSGKTKSALRLATGIKRIDGKPIYLIDTESKRALHYADEFDFEYLQFDAPFAPLDYLAAIEQCIAQGAGTVIIDSMSHEHEGPGGVLEMHDAECERLMRTWKSKPSRSEVQFSAWQKPKADRRRMINTLLQRRVNVIMCFRAKEKLKVEKGKQPESRGWMPIAAEELLYECTAAALMMPGAEGLPTWNPAGEGEKLMVKLPGQFKRILTPPRQLDEDMGEQMARWAEGDATAKPQAQAVEELPKAPPTAEDFDGCLASIVMANGRGELNDAQETCKLYDWSEVQRTALHKAINEKRQQLKEAYKAKAG